VLRLRVPDGANVRRADPFAAASLTRPGFDHHNAVGLSEIGGEDVDRVLAKVDHLCVEAGDLGCCLLVLTRAADAPSTLALESTQLAEATFESPRVGELTDHFVAISDCRQATNPDIHSHS
jgi:hypothetical protein